MIARVERTSAEVARFRAQLLIGLMALVSLVMAAVLFLAERRAAQAAETELRQAFDAELAGLRTAQELRHAALVERCRALVRRPRIHAALEDNALDLLYPSARDELADVMADPATSAPEYAPYALHAQFYRFLDRNGAVIPSPNNTEVGVLRPDEERRLALRALPDRQQLGYLPISGAGGKTRLVEIIAMPIVSSETGELIAALVLGFKPAELSPSLHPGVRRGWFVDGTLHLDDIAPSEREAVTAVIARAAASSENASGGTLRQTGGVPQLLFYSRVNPASVFPAAYEVSVYPLSELRERQRQLTRNVVGTAVVLLLGSFIASGLLANRLSRPVQKLAVNSAEDRAQRQRAEAALEMTNAELQRAARFSADASHQLKTPVTVLRAGLEELLSDQHLTPEECQEISALIQQTYRLSGIIDDLLLLSRMDAGRLKIDFRPVDLSHLVAAAIDDLSALADEMQLSIETDFPGGIMVQGERRYLSAILQNLLENARKYNRPGGRVQVSATTENGTVHLHIRNTGKPIPESAQAHIFERFHRGSMGENVPGYGLGLNLARELARLHFGDLRLVRSDDEWTEFEVTFRRAKDGVAPDR